MAYGSDGDLIKLTHAQQRHVEASSGSGEQAIAMAIELSKLDGDSTGSIPDPIDTKMRNIARDVAKEVCDEMFSGRMEELEAKVFGKKAAAKPAPAAAKDPADQPAKKAPEDPATSKEVARPKKVT